jgi:hypothetical protein
MKKRSIKNGDRVLYIPYNIFNGKHKDGVIEAYYLGERDKVSGQYLLATDPEKVKTFDKKTYIYPEDGIIVCDDYARIKKYNENLHKRYLSLISFLLKHEDTYNNATRFFLARDDFKELFTYYGYNSKLFDNLIKFPYFVIIRFIFNITWKQILGLIKRLIFPIIFMIDLIKFIYEEHYIYKESKRKLIQELHDNDSFIIRASTTEEQRKQSVETKRILVEAAKDVYSKSTINFFTLLISIISILVGIVYFSISSNKKDEEIASLQKENQRILIELYELKQNNQNNYMRETHLLQKEINNNLQINLKEITKILQELRETNNHSTP